MMMKRKSADDGLSLTYSFLARGKESKEETNSIEATAKSTN